jgi:hypothetical protein
VNGEKDRDQQGCQRQGEDPARPDVTRLSQSGDSDSDKQDDAEQTGDVESKLAHDTIFPEKSKQIGTRTVS